ncbi:MAG: MFS transporter, partial [Pseudorhodoplanes sp.]
MILSPTYAQVLAVLTAVTILVVGNGLVTTLVPLSATVQQFPHIQIGMIGSSYFVGMLIGCIACPRMVARA